MSQDRGHYSDEDEDRHLLNEPLANDYDESQVHNTYTHTHILVGCLHPHPLYNRDVSYRR